MVSNWLFIMLELFKHVAYVYIRETHETCGTADNCYTQATVQQSCSYF